MKKKLALALSVVMVLSLALTGCGKKDGPAKSGAVSGGASSGGTSSVTEDGLKPKDGGTDLIFTTGGDQGTYYGFGGVLANLVKRIDKTATRACVQDRASFDGCLAVASATDSE